MFTFYIVAICDEFYLPLWNHKGPRYGKKISSVHRGGRVKLVDYYFYKCDWVTSFSADVDKASPLTISFWLSFNYFWVITIQREHSRKPWDGSQRQHICHSSTVLRYFFTPHLICCRRNIKKFTSRCFVANTVRETIKTTWYRKETMCVHNHIVPLLTGSFIYHWAGEWYSHSPPARKTF